MKSLIKSLVETTGPSGYEAAVRDLIRREVEGSADSVSVDPLGSLFVRKGTKKDGGLRIMLSAHMDEIGVMVTHVDENGYVRFTNIGGVYPRNCIGGRVIFTNGTRGVIYTERMENPGQMPSLDKLFIDVGVESRDECPVKVGDVAAFDRPFMELGNRLVSKAMDDRIACAVQIEALRRIKNTPHELIFVFSVQEEVGLRGATAAGFSADPDLGISVDVTLTGDTPKGVKMDVALGKGPAIKVRDGRMLSDKRVIDLMIASAEKQNMPYQLEVLEGGTTDAAAIQLARAGVPAGCVSIPCRYVHSPSEMVDIRDVEAAVNLLVDLLSNPITLE